jgi:uncharacterized protein
VRLLIPVAALKPLLLFLLLLPAAALAARDTSNITNPRHVGSWIVDEGNVLTPAEKGALDGQLMQLEHEIGVEFPVAILSTVGDAVPKQFATELFNRWGVGKKGRDNGVLLLLVLDQKRAEIETGYGLEGLLPDAVCARVLREKMVPEFKDGHMGAGVLAGVAAITEVLRANPEEARGKASFARKMGLSKSQELGSEIGFGIFSLAMLAFLFRRWRAWRRYKPRDCKKCGRSMTLVAQPFEQYKRLNKIQQLEQKIQSYSYDVWLCPCSNVQIERYAGARAAEFQRCVGCGAQAVQKIRSHTVIWPSTTTTGLDRVTYQCLGCLVEREHDVVTPRVGGGYSSDGDSSSSSDGSGSSSSDFGGGSSGGGGAGASW